MCANPNILSRAYSGDEPLKCFQRPAQRSYKRRRDWVSDGMGVTEEHMPGVAQTVPSQLRPQMSQGNAGSTWPTPLNFFKELWEFWCIYKSCWLVNVDCSLVSLSFKYDVAKAARALLYNFCFGLSAGRAQLPSSFLTILLPFHSQRCNRQALPCTREGPRLGDLGMHRDWILPRKAYSPKSSLQQSHVLTQDGPRKKGVNPKFLCGGTVWQLSVQGTGDPRLR